MNYILFDGEVRNALLPFTYTRPVADIRIGILTIREKWEKRLGFTTTTLTEEYLEEKFPMIELEQNILINASFLPSDALVETVKNLKENRGAIVHHKGSNISPDWMPGQLNIAAALSFSGNQEIYLLTKKGEVTKRITKSWGVNVSPTFSPDGKKIAFTSNRGGTPQIYIKDLDSGDVKRVTFKGRYNTSPAWSPDGKKIAYVGIEKNKIDIFIINLTSASGMPVQLTMNQQDNEDPSWSPDGSLIAFTSNREGGVSRLFVMTSAGTDQRRLLTLTGKQSQPGWSKSTSFEN